MFNAEWIVDRDVTGNRPKALALSAGMKTNVVCGSSTLLISNGVVINGGAVTISISILGLSLLTAPVLAAGLGDTNARVFTDGGSFPDTSGLVYHLATNAVGRAAGRTHPLAAMEFLVRGRGGPFTTLYGNDFRALWNRNFWLAGVSGLSATCVGYVCTNNQGYSFPLTMVSPRHYLAAAHVAQGFSFFFGGDAAVFADTNNVIYYRHSVQWTNLGSDIALGILDADLPASVGFLPVLPGDYTNWLSPTALEGIGRNQEYLAFAEAVYLGALVSWSGRAPVPFGLGTNWTSCADPAAECSLRSGDSSSPVRLLVGNQLVLISAAHGSSIGPNYALASGLINAQMHWLSTNNGLGTDYQLSIFNLSGWPRN